MSAVLHVMLGEGGVGKTTLAAGYALALANAGRRVALLSIDPARRLQDALGLALDECPVRVLAVPPPGELHAALLLPEQILRRWATEGIADPVERARLLDNRLFRVLADRLATTADVIAAVRMVEWIEQDLTLTDFVVDTAPGRNGIEFLRRPRALAALLQGRLLHWLLRLGGRSPAGSGASHGPAARVLRGLASIAGFELLLELGQLVSAMEMPSRLVFERLERVLVWLHQPSTEILLVAAVREDATAGVRMLREALAEADLAPAAVVINRTLPSGVDEEIAGIADAAWPPDMRDCARYTCAYARIQARVERGVSTLAPHVIRVAASPELDGSRKLERLAELGRAIRLP